MVLLLLGVVAVALTVGCGGFAHRRAWSVAGGPTSWGAHAAARFDPFRGAVVVAAAGCVATIVIGLPLGVLAKSLGNGVDHPVFRWVAGQATSDVVTRQMDKLTLLGDVPMTQVLGLIGAVVLAFAYRRRWWIPLLVVGFALVAERELQVFLARVIDRGHPVGATGTYPSGGVGRPLAVYGAILALTLVLLPSLSRAQRAGAFTGLFVVAVGIGFTRLWLGKHWLTDVVCGVPFGALLLVTDVAIVSALTGHRLEQGVG